jgi:hypothetical protein
MNEKKPEAAPAMCSRCGQSIGAESEPLETGGEGFVCECCYAQILYPNLKINCMEQMDETLSR